MTRVTGRHALLVTLTLVALALVVAFARARSYVLHTSASCVGGCHADHPRLFELPPSHESRDENAGSDVSRLPR